MAQNASLASASPVLELVSENHDAKDYLVRKDGLTYAGTHVLVDFWGVSDIDDVEYVAQTLRIAAETCSATVLHVHVHEFPSSGGVSGVAVLAESHITVHTWPEIDYAAFDIFMCGDCDPLLAVPVLRRAFRPERVTVDEQKRGLVG
ncbi:MAG: adenosylmethionine decarboxylase [Rhodospirillales bacterium]|nr:adenosylmethionine decarboxylase [Rhodospirillales bacterium]